MSTTRWIVETDCDHPSHAPGAKFEKGHSCTGMSRIVVDPANLSPEAIQRAAGELAKLRGCDGPGNSGTPCATCLAEAEAAVRAFLSDPEETT